MYVYKICIDACTCCLLCPAGLAWVIAQMAHPAVVECQMHVVETIRAQYSTSPRHPANVYVTLFLMLCYGWIPTNTVSS